MEYTIDLSLLKGSQPQAFEEIIDFFIEGKNNILLLSGAAGTGKTKLLGFVMQELINRCMGSIIVMTFTGEAAKIAQEQSVVVSNEIEYSTLHSGFGLQPNKNSDKLRFKRNLKAGKVDKKHILFIDEASQIDNELFSYAYEESMNHKKVVFIGDRYQIPPIGMNEAVVFDDSFAADYGIQVVTLTEPVRQNVGSPILDTGDNIRERIKRPILFSERISRENEKGEKLLHLEYNKKAIYDLCKDFFLSKEYHADHKFFKLIAWTNREVDFWNNEVRMLLFGKKPENLEYNKVRKIVVGEKILSASPYIDGRKIIFSTNELLEVLDYSLSTVNLYGISFKHYIVKVRYFKGSEPCEYDVNVIHDDDHQKFYDLLERQANNIKKAIAEKGGSRETGIMWAEWWNVKEFFCEIRYNYARTAHTAQGSTFQNGVVLESDMSGNNKVYERNRIIYVGITRFSKTCINFY